MMHSFQWLAQHLAGVAEQPPAQAAPSIRTDQQVRILPDLDIWDHWPVLTPEGGLALTDRGLPVIALTAPILDDPDARHAVARLRLLIRSDHGWEDRGNVLPDGLNPGSREWAGSAVRHADRLDLFFTAAGHHGEARVGFEQRLMVTSARLDADGLPVMASWTQPIEIAAPDGLTYETDLVGGGGVGTIKAFRDPFFFRSGGQDHLLFAASRARVASPWNGLIGLASREGDEWKLRDPLVDATGLANELERPHIVRHDGLLYLFWSSQAKVFAPDAAGAPTGLYGVVADSLAGPWRPLNGSGLVVANPAEAPFQAYSWQVLPDLTVWSFADLVGLAHAPADTAEARAHFVGTPAPVLRLTLTDDMAFLS